MDTIRNFYKLNAIQPVARTFDKPLYKKNNRTATIKSIEIADAITLERADTQPRDRVGKERNHKGKASKI